jgi:Ca2+-dependent lipid-binding protein
MIAFVSVEISWALATAAIGVCALPCVLLGLPYLNEKFYVSYSKETGFKFGEEKRAVKRRSKERSENAEWANND